MGKNIGYIKAGISGILLSVSVLATGVGSLAYADVETEITKQELANELQAYYENRLAAFNKDYEGVESTFLVTGLVIEENEARERGLKEYEASIGAEFIDVKCNVVVEHIKTTEDGFDVNLHENVSVYYQYGENGPVDFFSFGTEHCVQIEKTGSEYKIARDYYDECMISNVDTYENIPDQEIEAETDIQSDIALLAASESNGYSGYSAGKAIAYADKYAQSVNSAYGEMTDGNGNNMDCANFVSQCLEAGEVAYTGSNYSSDWYFAKSQKQGSYAWVNVEKFDAFWRNYGLTRSKATVLSLLPGNPFYWLPDSSGHGHLMFCVGYNAAGVPIYNAHNPNAYHVLYTAVSSKTLYTMQFVSKCTSHTYSSFYGINTIYHYKVCSKCGYTVYTKHTFSNGKCTVCGVNQT